MHQRFENKPVINFGKKNNLGTILRQNQCQITNVFNATNKQ